MTNHSRFKIILFANLLSAAFAIVTASAEDVKTDYLWYGDEVLKFTNPEINREAMPFLEVLSQSGPYSYHEFVYPDYEKQKAVFLRDSRPIYINWKPDYLSLYKAIQAHYGKPEKTQLAAICPLDNKDLFEDYRGEINGMDAFEQRRALQQQKEIITGLWRNAKPVNKDTDVVYVGHSFLGDYSFDKHAFVHLNIPLTSGGNGNKNKNGEEVSVSPWPLVYFHQPGEIVITVFNKKLRLLNEIEMTEAEAEKMLAELKKDTPTEGGEFELTYAIHGNLIFDDDIIARAQCNAFKVAVEASCPSVSKIPKELDFSKCYIYDVKWIDYYRYSNAKKSLVKVFTTKF